jgi:hypothetical protein
MHLGNETWLCRTILGKPEVPEVKYTIAAAFHGNLVVGYMASGEINSRASCRFVTPFVASPPTWMMVRREGHLLRTWRTFETLVSSPTDIVALLCRTRYSVSAVVKSVVAGARTIPLRRPAVATSHLCRGEFNI